jgi:CHAD domain-containing protein
MAAGNQFEIKRRETFSEGIFRILEQLNSDTARLMMAKSRMHLSVHEARKNLKKLRAVLRLIRHEIGAEQYTELNTFYRLVAQQVAPVRDVTSQIELLENFENKIQAPGLRKVILKSIGITKKKRKKEFAEFYRKKIQDKVFNELRANAEVLKRLNIAGNAGIFIGKSVNKIFKDTLKCMQAAEKEGSNEAYHDFRKKVKYLMYQMMILKNAWPKYFESYISELDELQKHLGNLHDLNILNNLVVEGEVFDLDKKQKDAFLKYIYPRRASLKKQIHQIGSRIFVENSRSFSQRLLGIWNNSGFKII